MAPIANTRRLTAAVAALVIGAAVAAAMAALLRDRGQVYPNVFVAGVPLGGHTRLEAEVMLRADPRVPDPEDPVTVRAGPATYRCTVGDTGVSFSIERGLSAAFAVGRSGGPLRRLWQRLSAHWRRRDIPIPAAIDPLRAEEFITRCAQQFNRPPRDAALEVSGSRVAIVPDEIGIKVDPAAARQALRAWAANQGRGQLRLPAQERPPEVSAEDLEGIDTVLASAATPLAGSSRNRRHNIALAAAAIDGTMLEPGETFSYNQIVGPRTEPQGYRTAPVLVKGKLVPGTGGGACQLSSTLYQAALLAGLQIVSRSHHSRPVPYTPAGLDATVVYGAIDLRFRNSLARRILLQARVEGTSLVCRVLGQGPAPRVELARRVRFVQPPEPQVIEDPSLPVGRSVVVVEAARGVRVEVVRRQRGETGVSTELVSRDYYPYRRGVIRRPAVMGTAAAPAQTAPQPGTPGEAGLSGAAPQRRSLAPGDSAPPAGRAAGSVESAGGAEKNPAP